jgi:hypothetical protein
VNILEEAAAVVQDREQKYGPPGQHWGLTVALINCYFNIKLRPEDWATMMMLDKLARERHTPLRDNMVDVAGYANGRRVVLDCLPSNSAEIPCNPTCGDDCHCRPGKTYVYKWGDEYPTGKTMEEVP